MWSYGSMQIVADSGDKNELNHSHIVDTFMETYGNQVENADEVFGDESYYTTIVKVSVVGEDSLLVHLRGKNYDEFFVLF